MLEIFAAIYLLLPVLIFVLGWLKLYVAIPVAALLIYSSVVFLKNIPNGTAIPVRIKNRKYTVLIIVIIIGWVVLSGVGGFTWQNTWDHKFRNALFMDLVSKPWPVIQGDLGLCYYIGFWMPAAVVGKFFGLEMGYLFQLIWACIGVIIAVFLIFKKLGEQKIRTVILFIFFSGLDVLLYLSIGIFEQKSLFSMIISLLDGNHIELATRYFNSSSNTTLLFWLYNQIIPFWVGFATILIQQKNKAILYIYACMFFFCPFPCISLIPVVLYFYFKNQIVEIGHTPSICSAIKSIFSLENIALVPIILILLAYYSSNIAVNKISILPITITTLILFVAAFVAEFGFYLYFVYRDNKNNVTLIILLLITGLCSFVVMGNSYDFAWRTCIPLAFYLMILVAEKLKNVSFKRISCICLIFILLVGAVTPCTEFIRSVRMEYCVLTKAENARSDSLPTVFTKTNNQCYDNFIGDGKSFFFNHLCRRN